MAKRMQILEKAYHRNFSGPVTSKGGDIKRDIKMINTINCGPNIQRGFKTLYGMNVSTAPALPPHLYTLLDSIADVKVSILWRENNERIREGPEARCEELIERAEELIQDESYNGFEGGGELWRVYVEMVELAGAVNMHAVV